MAIPIIDGLLGLIKTGGDIFKTWQQRKVVESQGKVDIAKAKVEGKIAVEKKRADGDINYNVEAQRGMQASWKDEVFVVVWLSVFVGCFLPWTQPYVKDGFIFLKENTPDWYEWALLGMVTASFGLKGWKFWKNTKGNVTSLGDTEDEEKE